MHSYEYLKHIHAAADATAADDNNVVDDGVVDGDRHPVCSNSYATLLNVCNGS